MDEPTAWVGLSEAAKILGVHPATVRNWADRGHVPSQRTPGGHRRFRVADLQQWIDSHRQGMSAEAQLLVQSAMGRARLEIGEGQFASAPWYPRFDQQARDAMALYGRRLMEALERYLSTGADNALTLAHEFGLKYGHLLREKGHRLSEAVQGFFTFNEFVVDATIQVIETGRTGADRGEAVRKVSHFTREVILGLAEAYDA
ncbi:MAG: helix-turn-helix domain-containing protein [Anaerolineae bacterium]|nr:helix-turn-helix domain-containing protein [Anaerolineae bacterium]